MKLRNFPVFLTSVALFTFGYTTAIVIVPLIGTELDATSADVGRVVAVPGLLGVIIAIPAAGISNRLGRRPLMAFGFLCLGVGTLGFLIAPSFLWVVPGQMAVGLAMVTYWPSSLAASSELGVRHGHEKVQGLNTLLQGIASFMGALLGGAITAAYGPGTTLLVLLVVALAGLAAVLRFEETLPFSARSSGIGIRGSVSTAVHLLTGDRYVAVGTFALFPYSVLWWVAGASFLILLVRDAGYSAAFAGLLLGVRMGAASLFRIAFPLAARRIQLVDLLVGGNVVAALGLGIAALSTAPIALFISVAVQGLGLAVVLPAANVVVSRGTLPQDRVVGLSLSVTFNNAAVLISAPLLGAVAEATTIGLSLAVAAIAAAVLSLLMLPWRASSPVAA